jgi:hypothetical protein
MRKTMKNLVFLVGAPGVLLLPGRAWSEPEPRPTSFSVKDFGAKGDGWTDDTKAIQAAFDAAGKQGWSEQYPGSAYFITKPVVFFPSGKYLVSDTIKVGANVEGEGTAILQQKTAEKDIFLHADTWRWQLSGLTFVAGRHHLDIGNRNIDTGRIVIEKCAFYKAAGAAVKVREGSNSTQISIRDCVFIHCDQALVNYCDMAVLADSWISSSREMKDKAVIENRSGSLLLENICGVPGVERDNDQRWIDNYSTVIARNVRFGGESAGFTAVVNFAPYDYEYPVVPRAVVLDSCDIYCLGNPQRRAAIFCEEVPNQIVVRNCRGLCDLPMVATSEKLDLEAYFDNAERRRACLRFVIGEENVEVSDANRDLPEPMRPYQANRVVSDASPKSGHWQRGAMVWNRNREGSWTPQGFVKSITPADEEPLGWLCIESGKPGTWREVYGLLDRPSDLGGRMNEEAAEE